MQRLAVFFFLLIWLDIRAQNLIFPQRNYQIHQFEKAIVTTDSIVHTSIQPQTTFLSGVDRNDLESLLHLKQRKTWIGRKLFSENLIQQKHEDLFLTLDPLYNLQLGRDEFTGENLFQNTRGVIVNGEINKKLQFFTTFYENQGVFPAYLSNFIQVNNVFPGNGRVKTFGPTGYDFAMASGMISFNAFDWLNIQFGNHKNFIGNGYRSLLLSDNSFNYPHLKLIAKSKNNKWVYQSIYASLINLQRLLATTSSEPQFQRKAATFHYLSFKPNSKFSVGLFEGIIWQRRNDEGSIPFNWNFVNPIWGFNSAFTGFDRHQTNNTLGLNFAYIPVKPVELYGQALFAELDLDKIAWQAGFKYFDAFTLKNFTIQGEININEGMNYQIEKNLYLSYFHYNQPLGFTIEEFGAELLGVIKYNFKGVYVNAINSYSPSRNFFMNELGYRFNKFTGLGIGVFYARRMRVEDSFGYLFGSSNWMGIKISTNINNYYLDF